MCLKLLPILILPKSKLLNFSDNENNFAKQIRKQIYSSGEQGEEEEFVVVFPSSSTSTHSLQHLSTTSKGPEWWKTMIGRWCLINHR